MEYEQQGYRFTVEGAGERWRLSVWDASLHTVEEFDTLAEAEAYGHRVIDELIATCGPLRE